MNLLPEGIGGNKKQYMWLGGLVVVLIAVYFLNSTPSQAPVTPVTTVKTSPSIARPGAVVPDASSGPKLATRSGRRVDDFRPSLKLPEGIDVTKIDPTLKIDLLAKLQKVPLEGGARSVFDYGAPPPAPPPPPVAPIKPEVIEAQNKARAEAEKARQTIKPPPPPIPLKFYGYANRSSSPSRQAFFLDGEDIQIKGENDVIRGRYKIIRIGVNSAVVEDLQSHDQQTLPLVAELNT